MNMQVLQTCRLKGRTNHGFCNKCLQLLTEYWGKHGLLFFPRRGFSFIGSRISFIEVYIFYVCLYSRFPRIKRHSSGTLEAYVCLILSKEMNFFFFHADVYFDSKVWASARIGCFPACILHSWLNDTI